MNFLIQRVAWPIAPANQTLGNFAAVGRLAARRLGKVPWRISGKLALAAVLVAVIYLAIGYGVSLRRWAWDQTADIRFMPDIQNGFNWGKRAAQEGYLEIYQELAAAHPKGDYGLDYAPLRLWIMRTWVQWHQVKFPGTTAWSNRYEETAPLLTFNTCCELAASIAVFLLVRFWVRRAQLPPASPFPAQSLPPGRSVFRRLWLVARWLCGLAAAAILLWHYALLYDESVWNKPALRWVPLLGVAPILPWLDVPLNWRKVKPQVCGLIAALLLWFNPAAIWDGHCWPQWEVWALPFFLFAALAASRGSWFVCGILVGLGAMFKAQLLLAAPLFLLWPLFGGQPGAVVSCLSGIASSAAVVAWPWLMRSDAADTWLASVCGATVLAFPWPLYRRVHWGWRVGMTVLAAALLLWPALHAPELAWLWWGVLALLAVGLFAARSWPIRRFATVLIGAAATCVLLCGTIFADTPLPPKASAPPAKVARGEHAYQLLPVAAAKEPIDGYAWARIGFGYGTYHYPTLATGRVCNLATLLSNVWGWSPRDPALKIPAWRFPAAGRPWISLDATAVPIRALLVGIYAVVLVLCSAGAAMQARRGSTCVLIAMVAPWVLLFTFLPQMHERYLVWGAALTAVAAGVGIGSTLLHLFLSGAAWTFMAASMLKGDQTPQLLRFVNGTYPGLGFAMVAAAVILLYVAIMPRGNVAPCHAIEDNRRA